MTSHRALIRHALVRVLKEDGVMTKWLAKRVYANRKEHWLADEFPAAGVYTLSEEILASDISPDPFERRISLTVELLASMTDDVDDDLDALTQAAENALSLEAIGRAMTAIVNDKLVAAGQGGAENFSPLPPVTINGIPRTSAMDTLLTLKLTDIEIGIAVDGARQIGVAAMNFDLEYAMPVFPPPLADFLLGFAGWDVEPADGIIDMESLVQMTEDRGRKTET